MEEVEKLFNYKGKDILIRRKKGKYCIGVRDKVDIWLESATYNTIKLAKTSGREYARIIIDKMLVSLKNK